MGFHVALLGFCLVVVAGCNYTGAFPSTVPGPTAGGRGGSLANNLLNNNTIYPGTSGISRLLCSRI